jgi:uncharacterized protein YqiB (DUF1249 family)
MSPTYKMPDPVRLQRDATVAEACNALHAARCAVQLAGSQTEEFVVREVLLRVIQQLDRAAAALRRLS